MLDRRDFLGLGAIALPASLLGGPPPAARLRGGPRPALQRPAGQAQDVARDEAFWSRVQSEFTADRSLINLNNGGVSPSPTPVQEALARHLSFSNGAPAHRMWHIQEPQKETVRAGLARLFGCDTEEIAITRNASESLQICQFGFDLKAGDEVLTTDQDYPRMITTFEQRQRREGIVLRKISLPVPLEDPNEVVRLFEENISERTRLILMCHMINLTGQILPVKAVVRAARERGIPVIVDGAHAFAHFPFQLADLDCDYYATSLHKWLFAPFGTGMLYVRRSKIADLWPLMAAREGQLEDIRKFEEIGTHPVALPLSIADALLFHESLGAQAKAQRLVYLRDLWVRRLVAHERVRLHTHLAPGAACGIANFQLEGVDSGELVSHLWKEHRILTTPIKHPNFEGLRISPSVYTTPREIERFASAVERVIAEGLPA